MISTYVSMQPPESSLNSSGFLKVFLGLPLPLSLDSVFFVANASSVLFIISQVLAHVMASGATLVLVLESSRAFVVFEVLIFLMVLDPPPPPCARCHPEERCSFPFIPLRFYEVNSGTLRSICYQLVLRCGVSQESIQFKL